MTSLLKTLPLVVLAVAVATPSLAAGKKHKRHHRHHVAVVDVYGYGPGPQRPVYSNVTGRLIGRANDTNIRTQMQNDDILTFGR